MSEVQMKPFSSKGPEYSNKYMVNGALPSDLRKPHQVLCCVFYVILAWGFIGSLTLGVKQGNLSQFLHSTGQGFRCGFGAAANFPYAYFYNPLVNNKTVCADKCPTMTQAGIVQPIDCYFNFRCGYLTQLTPDSEYNPVLQGIKVIGYPTIKTAGNLCLPVPSLMSKAFKPAGFTIYQRITQQHQKVSYVDFLNKYYLILICAGAAIILSILSQILVRNVSYKKILWPFLGLTVVLMLGISFAFLYLAGALKVPLQNYAGYLGLAYFHTQNRYLGLSIFFFLLSVFFIVVTALQIYRVKAQIKPHQDYQAIYQPEFGFKQFLLYFEFVLLFLSHWILCIFAFIELITSVRMNAQEKYSKVFTETISQFTIQKFLAFFVVFWAIWGGYVIIGVFKTMIALMYTQKGAFEPKNRKNQILDYIVIVLYHHFGSIVVSSFFVPVIGEIAEFLIWAFKIDVTKKGPADFLAKILKVFNPAVYLNIAIEGNNYLTSCRRSYIVIWDNEKQEVESLQKIQTEKLVFTSIKTVTSLLCPLLILSIFTYSVNFHKEVFEPLWIVVPSWLIGLGIADILLYGIQSQTRIRKINNFFLFKDDQKSMTSYNKSKRNIKIYPETNEQRVQQKEDEKQPKSQNTKKQT